MIPELEVILWVILPVIVALIISVASINCLRRARRILQYCICIPTLILMAAAIAMLVPMLYYGAWPNFFPHIAIGVCLPLVVVQDFLAR